MAIATTTEAEGRTLQLNMRVTAEELRLIDLVVRVREMPGRSECLRQFSLTDAIAEARRIEESVSQASVG